MTLDELITALDAADPTLVLPHGFTNPHSYRGYYEELAFEPATDVPVADMLADARSARGATFTGWKGGDFVMRGYTDCWLAQEGSAGGETLGPLLLQFMLDAGIRDAARTASGQQPETTCHPAWFAGECPCPTGCGCCKVAAVEEPDPTTADDPTPLRWGLGDVLWGDDDTITICMSGPDRAPYWLELNAERAAALRDALAGPDGDSAVGQPATERYPHQNGDVTVLGPGAIASGDGQVINWRGVNYVPQPTDDGQLAEVRRDIHEALVVLPAPEADRVRGLMGRLEAASRAAVGQPAEAQATDEARPPATSWTACRRGDTDWLVASSNYDDRDQALERLAKRRKEQPNAKFALVRETTTWTVEDER